MKKDESEKQKIGLLAQDMRKYFLNLFQKVNGVKSVNYQGLVPVLINALKEQQSRDRQTKKPREKIGEIRKITHAILELRYRIIVLQTAVARFHPLSRA